jgi:teichuronic acid biosynthesis glycosyltransferase TuaC
VKVLVVTNMWPTPTQPQFGVFVHWEVEELRRLGIDADVLFIDGRTATANYAKGIRLLHQSLRRRSYALVHAHYVFSAVVARTQRQLPIVLTHHGIEVLQGWQAPLSAGVSHFVDGLIVKSKQMRARLRRPDAQVIPSGVDLDVFDPVPRSAARQRLGLAQDKRIVLYVGESRPEKRLDVIEAAVALVRTRRQDVELRMVSGLPQPEVARNMSAADVLVLASDGEGSPTVIKEAMACNLPIVSVDVGDVREVIAGTHGCAICAQDPEDMADKIEVVLKADCRTTGREAVAQYSWSAIAEQVRAFYARVLDAPAGTAAARSSRRSLARHH